MKKERRHCEQQRYGKRTENFIYRERSIDDGSHFDPYLDKYTTTSRTKRSTIMTTTPAGNSSTLRKRDQQSQTADKPLGTNSLKRNKKLGGFEKVKQLFGAADKKDVVERKSMSSTTSSSAGTQQTIKAKDHKDKNNKYMVKEDEMRSRYREYNGGVPAQASNSSKTTTTTITTTTTTNPMQNENMREPKVSERFRNFAIFFFRNFFSKK